MFYTGIALLDKVNLYKRLYAYFKGVLHRNRAARKGQFGQAIITVLWRWFSHASRCSEKSIWTSYYKHILKVVFTWVASREKIDLDKLLSGYSKPFCVPACCCSHLCGNHMKHKVWGSFLGRTNAEKCFQGAKKAPPDLMFNKVSARLATKAGGHAKRLDLDKLL